jgi:hypothetical protein
VYTRTHSNARTPSYRYVIVPAPPATSAPLHAWVPTPPWNVTGGGVRVCGWVVGTPPEAGVRGLASPLIFGGFSSRSGAILEQLSAQNEVIILS